MIFFQLFNWFQLYSSGEKLPKVAGHTWDMWDTWPYMHSKNLFSQCNLTAQIELVQPKQFKEKKIELHQYWMKKALVICWPISISYGFGDKLKWKGAKFQNFILFFVFLPILIKFFAKLSPLWFIDRTFKKFSHLISKKGSERCPNSEISQILRKVYQIFIFHHILNTY